MERWLEPLVLFGIGGACFVWERRALGRSTATRRDYATDVKSLAMAIVSSALVAAVFAALLPSQAGLGSGFRPWRVIGAVVLFDFILYWLHRFCHSAAWPIHRRHHAPKHFEVSMAFRDSWLHLLLYGVLLRCLGLALALSPAELAVLSSVFIAFQWWAHLRVPVSLWLLDFVVIGPKHHAIHHRHEKRAWSKNLGGLLCVWDQLFGTYAHPF